MNVNDFAMLPKKSFLSFPEYRLRAMFGCTEQALALFRVTLGISLSIEILLRFRFLHPFYSDEGTHPLNLLRPKVDWIYKIICVHCHVASVSGQHVLLIVQLLCAMLFTLGYRTSLTSAISWFLYLSLTLRNTWLSYILDRYFHYLLFYSMFLPLDAKWSTSSRQNKIVASIATAALKLQILWIYVDAGGGKFWETTGAWSYNAKSIPALDTYARHTPIARYLYALLGPHGLRILTPIVVYVELFSAPLSLIATFYGWPRIVRAAIATICLLHLGIGLTINNTLLLSLVACAAWTVYLPPDSYQDDNEQIVQSASKQRLRKSSIISGVLIVSLILGSIWFEAFSKECNQSMDHIWSTLLHNRWNVFVGAEEYVTWEIAPGRLADNSVVDVWRRTDTVDWRMPGAGASSPSKSRPGRWRSFPYLAKMNGDEAEALWSYLCRQWDEENNVLNNPGRALVRFNFYMLKADVLPNMGFSATRKRLIKSYSCSNGTAVSKHADRLKASSENEL